MVEHYKYTYDTTNVCSVLSLRNRTLVFGLMSRFITGS